MAKDNGTRRTRRTRRIVGRTIVDNHGGGYKWTRALHNGGDVVSFVESRNDRGDPHWTVLQKS
jgi:hypothetical protein